MRRRSESLLANNESLLGNNDSFPGDIKSFPGDIKLMFPDRESIPGNTDLLSPDTNLISLIGDSLFPNIAPMFPRNHARRRRNARALPATINGITRIPLSPGVEVAPGPGNPTRFVRAAQRGAAFAPVRRIG
jgi:hypothetical protein